MHSWLLSEVWNIIATQPICIFNRENPQNSESPNGPRREFDFITLNTCNKMYTFLNASSQILSYLSITLSTSSLVTRPSPVSCFEYMLKISGCFLIMLYIMGWVNMGSSEKNNKVIDKFRCLKFSKRNYLKEFCPSL